MQQNQILKHHELKAQHSPSKYRKALAESASKSDGKYMKSIKLPVKTTNIDHKLVHNEHNRIFSMKEGGLLYYVINLHLLGFNFYSSYEQSNIARNLKHIRESESDFIDRFNNIDAQSFELFTFDLSKLLALFSSSPRNTNFTTDNIINRTCQFLNSGKKIAIDSGRIYDLIVQFSKEAVDIYDNWNNFCSDEGVELFDKIFVKAGVPSLKNVRDKMKVVKPISSSIVYDTDMLSIIDGYDEDVAIYQVVSQKMRKIRLSGEKPTANTIEDLITTQNSNAISWVLGTGLKYFQSEKVSTIAEDLECGEVIANKIRDAARSIKSSEMFDIPSYNKYRTSIGMVINSWVTQYVKRLLEIESTISTIDVIEFPDDYFDENNIYASKILSFCKTNAMQLNDLQSFVISDVKAAHESINRLSGLANELPTRQDLINFNNMQVGLGRLSGMISEINHKVKQVIENIKDPAEIRKFENLSIKEPSWLKFDKLNRFSSGCVDFDKDINQLADGFNFALERQKAHYLKITNFLSEIGKKDLYHEFYKLKPLKHPSLEKFDKKELVARYVLEKFMRYAKRTQSNDVCKIISEASVQCGFFHKRKANKIFLSRISKPIFKYGYDKGKSGTEYLVSSKHNVFDFVDLLESKLHDYQPCQQIDEYAKLMLISMIYMLKIEPIKNCDQVPPELCWLDDKVLEYISVDYRIKKATSLPYVDGATIISMFGYYSAYMRGVSNTLFRKEFTKRYPFSEDGRNHLVIRGKTGTFKFKKGFLSGDQNKEAFSLFQIIGFDDVKTYQCSDAINMLKNTPKAYLQSPHLKKIIECIPHKFCLSQSDIDKNKEYDGVPVYNVSKEKSFVKISKEVLNDLVIPRAYKDILLGAIDKTYELGSYGMHYVSKYKMNSVLKNGQLKASYEHIDSWLELAIPYKQYYEKSKLPVPYEDKIIAFDIGEYNLGYAVFNIRDKSLLESGRVPTSVGNIAVHKADKYRGYIQPKQKYSQKTQNIVENARNNAVKTVASIIDSLSSKYKAFPIIESEMAGSNGEISKIISQLGDMYGFSPIEAHKNKKKNHFYGANEWRIEGYTVEGKDLVLYPARQSSNYATSQICSSCERNPVSDIYDHFNKGDKVKVENGFVMLPNGTKLKLVTNINSLWNDKQISQQARLHAQKNRRLPFNYFVKDGEYSQTQVIDYIKKQISRANDSVQIKDSSKSRYYCAYENCGFEIHSEENAAINQGRKFLIKIDEFNE
ncbi:MULTISPECIES: type V CRISPR-associated protein Cas12c [Cysteiniphilum]|uniref:Uncharacterized protein n=1 Tax=Cysteiniphilum litorale TaxID=2056700 RepID=A0A8J3E8H0_9GAMM|nr:MULTISPECIES: type V CRISPR-associated protein Cas12c [Cysteiniphilum]GGF91127.1 hypothetical protein GCM10010995_05510 [Cysteiniphilum litorale]